MYRLQDNVPEYLINESRDFQLLCRIADCNNNGVKFSIDSIIRVMNTTNCGSGFLRLLESRLGFFTDGQYTDTEIRDILIGFCDMIKYKGTELGIKRAVRTFLIAKNIKVPTKIVYDDIEKYRIGIGLRSKNLDTSLLDDILRYVMPAGCIIDYFYYIPEDKSTDMEYGQRVIWVFADDKNTSRVVRDYNIYEGNFSHEASYVNQTNIENSAIGNMLSNIGFINLYSKFKDQTGEDQHWSVKTIDNTIDDRLIDSTSNEESVEEDNE